MDIWERTNRSPINNGIDLTKENLLYLSLITDTFCKTCRGLLQFQPHKGLKLFLHEQIN